MNTQEIREVFNKRLKRLTNQSFFARVKDVDEQLRVCTVTVGTLIYEEVLLYSTTKEDLKGFVFIPKIGSQVVVGRLQGTDNLFVSQYSEVKKALLTMSDKHSIEMVGTTTTITNDKSTIIVKANEMEIKVGEAVIKGTDKGLTLVKGSFGLLKTLNELCDAISKLTVSTAVGASSPPINMADFVKIKTELKNYMEG